MVVEKREVLTTDLHVSVAFKANQLTRSEHVPQDFLPTGVQHFSHLPDNAFFIECQVWGGSFDVSRNVELCSHTTHCLLGNEMGSWVQSPLQYSQLLPNPSPSLSPLNNSKDPLGNQIREFLSQERKMGPHIWFEVKLPDALQFKAGEENNASPKSNVLAVGVLPLVSYAEKQPTVLRQGLHSVRLFPVGTQMTRSADYYIPLATDRSVQYQMEKRNQLRALGDQSFWLNQAAEKRLAKGLGRSGVPDNYVAYGCNHHLPPAAIIGLLEVELPYMCDPQVILRMDTSPLPRDERVNITTQRTEDFPEMQKVLQRDFSTRSVEERKRYLSDIVLVRDYQVLHSHKRHRHIEPVEAKYQQLSWNMEPSYTDSEKIKAILQLPPTHPLSSDQMDLLWNFRRHLTNDGRALKKFLAAIRWNNGKEKTEALRLLQQWKYVPPQDAIEILLVCPNAPVEVYLFAVDLISRLKNLPNYLLELIQKLQLDHQFTQLNPKMPPYPLFELLMSHSEKDFTFCNNFYWFLKSEASSNSHGKEIIYGKFMDLFEKEIRERKPDALDVFRRQQEFIASLAELYEDTFEKGHDIATHTGMLRAYLKEKFWFEDDPLPLPIDPNIRIVGFDLEQCSVMKSNARPFRLTFLTEGPGTFTVLYKSGDDLRQDMFFLQMLQFVNTLFLSENFDLHLTPYRVLATSRTDGFVEFVRDSTTLADIDIQQYLREHNPGSGPYGIDPKAMEIFLRSCAGYCVVTYLFGVGDRHGHNLMLKKTGDFFHIDFGYIFGKDPKPFPPPFKLSPGMVKGMGNQKSEEFRRFCRYCCEAYNRVRSQGNVILALTSMMADADIKAIDEDIHTIQKLEQNFKLKKSDEDASEFFMTLINDSANALFSRLADIAHNWAQYWGK